MSIKRQGPARPNGFRAVFGKNPGEVELRTYGAKRATFVWEMATNVSSSIAAPTPQDNWEQIGSGTQAHIIVTGLTGGSRYFFG